MRSIEEAMELDNPEELLEELRSHVSLRDQMCGPLYYNVLNEECCQIANKLVTLGVERSSIESILGGGTFQR